MVSLELHVFRKFRRIGGFRCFGRAGRRLFLTAVFLGLVSSAGAEPPRAGISDTEKVMLAHSEGLAAFASRDYAGAVEKLKQFLSLLPQDIPREWSPALEAAYLTLAAASYNLGDYEGTISACEKFLARFPNSTKSQDARMNLAIAAMKSGNSEKARTQLNALQQIPALRNRVLLYQAMLSLQTNQVSEAVPILENFVGPSLVPDTAQKAAGMLLLAEALLKLEKWDRAGQVIRALQDNPQKIDNPLQLNSLTLELGDHHAEQGLLPEALSYYSMARFQADLQAGQEKKISILRKEIGGERDRKPAQGAGDSHLADLENALFAAESALENFKTLAGYDESVWFRIGRAYLKAGRPWEAYLVLKRMLEQYPASALRDPIMSMWVFSMAEIVPYKETQEACLRYLKEFPKGERAEEIAYLSGAVALQNKDLASAETFFGRIIKEQPESRRRGEMIYLLGNVNFMQGKFPEARERYQTYQREFPKGEYSEEIACRLALTYFFEGDIARSVAEFQNYLGKYPKGNYVSEARYRLEVADYAAKEYEKVIAACQQWAVDFPHDPLQAENAALLGDAYAALERFPEAAEAYSSAVRFATTDEVIQYALLEAQKAYQKTGDWEKIGELFREFVDTHPESPLSVMAVYWIGRAKERLGQPEEARRLTAENIRRHIADRQRDAVEQLLLLYAQLEAKRKTGGDIAPEVKVSAAEAVDLEIEAALTDPARSTPLTKARILFAQAEAARLKRNPERVRVLQDQIAGNFQPEELSAPLLVLAGDRLLEAGKTEEARAVFETLKNDFPKSALVDAADVGLGKLALRSGNIMVAEKHFRAAVAKPGAKMPDAMVGLGRTQMERGQLPEAIKTFQQVAGTKQWRGEATAESLYYLGEIERRQQRYAEANAYFQRVFVSWRKYPKWVARAYLASAECFDSLGRKSEALRTWQEMVRQENLSGLPEFETARKELASRQPSP